MSSNANSNKNKRKSLTQNVTTAKKVKSLEIEDKSDESGDEFDSTIEDDDDTIEKKIPFEDNIKKTSVVWKFFKKYTWQKISKSTNKVLDQQLRVYCECNNCTKYFTYKTGGSTRNMNDHLKIHNISESDPNNKKEEDRRPEANQEQLNSIFYYMTMFLITAGLSFRTIENKYFKLLVTEFFKVQFSWPGRRKIRKLVAKFAKEKEENIKEKLNDAKKVSITTDCWTSKFQQLGVF
jgi:hypothetical protein